jgi:hypothetical protein
MGASTLGRHRVRPRVQTSARSALHGVPPRPRQPRAGAHRGALSRELRQALRAEAARLARLGDPEAQIRGVSDAFAALDPELARLSEVRYRAIQTLRREGGRSYERLVAASGLSKTRVAQQCRDLENGN